jgi:hypothetical protein
MRDAHIARARTHCGNFAAQTACNTTPNSDGTMVGIGHTNFRYNVPTFEVSTAVYLRIQISWDTMLCVWVGGSRYLVGNVLPSY